MYMAHCAVIFAIAQLSCLEYHGYNLSDDIRAIDVELVEAVINKLERGKAADIHGLSAEHLLFCNPIISVVLAKLFELIICNVVMFPTVLNVIISLLFQRSKTVRLSH